MPLWSKCLDWQSDLSARMSDHWIFLLITSHAHQHSHSDVAATTVKTKFWILKGSKQSKSIKYKCGFCCTHCIAPYNVKIARNNTAKHYGVSLTCLNTAAVHLEMAVNISGILQIIQRFFALWGQPTVMLCDNSSEFVGAEKKLHQMINILNQEEVKVLWRERNAVEVYCTSCSTSDCLCWSPC